MRVRQLRSLLPKFSPHAVVRFLVVIAVALLGALLASAIHAPLPWMLGPLVATSVISVGKLRLFGEIPNVPIRLRDAFVPIIGLMIGAQVTYDTVLQAGRWWPSLLLVVPFAFLTLLINYALLRKFGGYDKATAFFASTPGGAAQAAILGEEYKADAAKTVIQHFARISLTVTLIPLLLSLYFGHVVGSAGGASMDAADSPLALSDVVLLAAGAVFGWLVAGRLRLSAPHLIGPLVASAVLHATGLTSASVPALLVNGTQLVIGANLGGRFAKVDARMLSAGFAIAVPALAVSMSIALVAGLVVSWLGINSAMIGFISFAPGGVAEMSLIAISIDADPVFVACHHIVRILTAVMVFPVVFRHFFRHD
jgi:membrane AbrB-like protein